MFGTGAPEISNTTSGSLVLNYSKVLDNFTDAKVKELVSLTGERTFHMEDYASFIIYVNLFKTASPKVELNSILQYEKTTVQFKRHYDETEQLYNNDFWVTEIIPFYLESTTFEDKVLIKITSAPSIEFYKSGFGKYYGREYGKRGW